MSHEYPTGIGCPKYGATPINESSLLDGPQLSTPYIVSPADDDESLADMTFQEMVDKEEVPSTPPSKPLIKSPRARPKPPMPQTHRVVGEHWKHRDADYKTSVPVPSSATMCDFYSYRNPMFRVPAGNAQVPVPRHRRTSIVQPLYGKALRKTGEEIIASQHPGVSWNSRGSHS